MEINFLAILVCGVVAMVIGFVWYGPLFGKAFMRVMGVDNMSTEERQVAMKGVKSMYALQFLLSLITAGALSIFLNNLSAYYMVYVAQGCNDTNICNASIGMWPVFLIWFGFVMTTTAGAALWSGKPKKLAWNMFLITAGAQLVTFIAFGLILGAW